MSLVIIPMLCGFLFAEPGATEHDHVQEVIDAWTAHRENTPPTSYVVETPETHKGFRIRSKDGTLLPAEDYTTTLKAKVILDSVAGSMRVEFDYEIFKDPPGAFVPRRTIVVYDGKQLVTEWPHPQTSSTPEKAGESRVTRRVESSVEFNDFNWRHRPLLFAHGIVFPFRHGEIPEDFLHTGNLKKEDLEYAGQTSDGLLLLQTINENPYGAMEEFAVDSSRGYAIVQWVRRYERDPRKGDIRDGMVVTCDIKYTKSDDRWVPASWQFDQKTMDTQFQEQHKRTEFVVTSVESVATPEAQSNRQPSSHYPVFALSLAGIATLGGIGFVAFLIRGLTSRESSEA